MLDRADVKRQTHITVVLLSVTLTPGHDRGRWIYVAVTLRPGHDRGRRIYVSGDTKTWERSRTADLCDAGGFRRVW